jgi:DNA-binding transcriptional MerR regulator
MGWGNKTSSFRKGLINFGNQVFNPLPIYVNQRGGACPLISPKNYLELHIIMNEMSIDRQMFTIKELSEKLDIPKPTLRFWEKELEGIIVPLRSTGGQRRYTESHIPLFEKIKNLRNEGRSISQVKELFSNGNEIIKLSDTQDDIEVLTQRISELVKMEVIRFLGKK